MRLRAVAIGTIGLLFVATSCRLPVLVNPFLVLEGHILTQPFAGSTQDARDGEGLAYVKADDTIWYADDNGRELFEVDADDGTLLGSVELLDYLTIQEFGGGATATVDNSQDLEAMAYNADTDELFALSGSCCPGDNAQPTIFRLTRNQAGDFEPVDFQEYSGDYSGATHIPGGDLLLVDDEDFSTYDYATNTFGSAFNIAGLTTTVYGLGFDEDGRDLWAVDGNAELHRVEWATKTLVPGYTFDLTAEGIDDPRAVEMVGSLVFVLDGDDSLRNSDPLKYAVHVFSIDGTYGSPLAPTASFTFGVAAGGAPGTWDVSFDATASDDPDGTIFDWSWYFGDASAFGAGETVVHTYATDGSYPVFLVVSDDNGNLAASVQTVTLPPPP